MDIILYKTSLCPRCRKAEKYLRHLVDDDPRLNLVSIDVLAHPLQSWRAGIRMFPAIKCRKRILSGLILTGEQIRRFVKQDES